MPWSPGFQTDSDKKVEYHVSHCSLEKSNHAHSLYQLLLQTYCLIYSGSHQSQLGIQSLLTRVTIRTFQSLQSPVCYNQTPYSTAPATKQNRMGKISKVLEWVLQAY